MTTETANKLSFVHAHRDAATGQTVYMGCFEDGFLDVLRRSFRTYASVAQLRRYSLGARGEFIFSSKPSVALGRAQRPRLICECKIEMSAIAKAAGRRAELENSLL
jgi:hypothetical protein